jgi:hypothetical protein
MRLFPEMVQKVIDHLNHFAKTECPVCHHDEWTVSDILFAIPEYEFHPFGLPPPPPGPPSTPTGTPTMAGFAALSRPAPQVFPVVPVTCVTCGYVFLFSAIKLGLVSGRG